MRGNQFFRVRLVRGNRLLNHRVKSRFKCRDSQLRVLKMRRRNDDRIYVARGLTPTKLASTLVHEVNHFINKSEEHYRGPTQGLLEEYRSFYVEKLFAGVTMTPARCKALKEEVAREYGFTKAHLERIPDVPPGLLIPP